jgi:creatinine amidohydrolase
MHLADLTWPEIGRLAPDTPVILPVAAVEQHGHHLPVATDSILLGEIVRRVETRMHESVLVAPLLWLGNSHHHMDFAGTLSARPRVYLDVVGDLIENLLAHDFRRIFLLNGHGGNIIPGRQAVFEARQRHRDRDDLLLLFATYADFAKPNVSRAGLVQSSLGHACEWETSMMLAVRPDLVKPFAELPAMDMGYSFEPAYRGWITRERRPAGADSPGHLGDPRGATAEKGEYLLEQFAATVAGFLEKVVAWDGRSWEFPARTPRA